MKKFNSENVALKSMACHTKACRPIPSIPYIISVPDRGSTLMCIKSRYTELTHATSISALYQYHTSMEFNTDMANLMRL